jgi:mRNA interferase RelE/StbE
MSSYALLYKKPAAKEIQKLPQQIRKRLKAKLEWFIAQDNPLEFAEPLTKPTDAQYRFRVGTYRILFDVEKNCIVILHIQHRREVYRSR